ncbi:Exocyst complex component 5, partial [Irineochytrium annulatum]
LNALAKEVDIPGTELARVNIERYCEDLEKDILIQFDAAYRKGDKALMNRCAKILIDLNGGNSCVQTYVNQHEFFINRNMVTEEDFEVKSDDEDEDEVRITPLLKLYEEIRAVVPAEWATISVVFPNSVSVMRKFIQRIYAQSIQNHVEVLLTKAGERSPLFYLRSLAACHASTSSLNTDLRKFDDTVIAPTCGGTNDATLGGTLERCFEDLFVPYTDGERWIDVERQCLVMRMEEGIKVFVNAVATKKKTKLKKQQTVVPNMQAVGQLLNMVGMDSKASSGSSVQQMTPDEQGHPSAETVLAILGVHIEAMGRCRLLCKPAEQARNGTLLFREFVDIAGGRYLKVGVDMAFEELTSADAKVEPDLNQSMPVICVCNQILRLFQLHFQTVVVPLVSSSPTSHRETVIFKNEFMSGVETLVNKMLQKQIETILHWLSVILARQKKTDFRPKDESLTTNMGTTLVIASIVCQQVSDFLLKVYARCTKNIDGENLEVFLNEIGSGFHNMLLDHLKKFTYSYTGGVILTKDLAKYYETFTCFRCQSITERFEMLREIGNLFIVKPENLKTVLSEGYLARIEINLLQPFLMTRTDWAKIQ